MRITAKERQAIREATADIFGPDAKVRLFGSRVDDAARGGDLDLLVECPRPIESSGALAARLSARIQMRIGERAVDVLCTWPGMNQSPVHRAAAEQGVLL